MPAYVPPQMRGGTAKGGGGGGESRDDGDRERRPPAQDRPSGGGGGGRFDSLGESEARPARSAGGGGSAGKGTSGGKGGGGGGGGGKGRDGDREERREERGGRDDREDRDEPRDEAPPRSGGADDGGRRGGGGGNEKAPPKASSNPSGAPASGGDWRQRQDGSRRAQKEDKTELEIFGEVKGRSTAGIDFDKYDEIDVSLSGRDVDGFTPIQRFSDGKLMDSIFDNLRRCGYDRPTPIQRYSIPIVVSGRDLMACAQTGSGKTCAFMVPCLQSLLISGPPSNAQAGNRKLKPMPCGLVLAPTRELAIQIHQESNKFSYETGIRCCIMYGGADMLEQKRDMDRGCDILIATPGRLTDMIERNNVSMEMVQFFILDEADRMLDMGFEPAVRQIVKDHKMGTLSKFGRQSMMFSATFAEEVQHMARDFLNDYVFITVGRVGSASELITQTVIYAEDLQSKCRNLERAIKDHLPKDGLCVVFVETKKAADELEMYLYNANVKVTAIHGDRSQDQREEALHAFKTGANPVLVATNVAARGLDIPNVALVINFDMPKDLDDYVHRIGRTGRAGRKGVAVAFINERCSYLHNLGDLLQEAKQDIPQWFSDLCRNARPRGLGKGKGKGEGKANFGGQDLRLQDGVGLPTLTATSTSKGPSTWNQPTRGPNDFGITGLPDAW